jgi:hypothetical protein
MNPKVGEIWMSKNALVLFIYKYPGTDMCECAILDSTKKRDIGDTIRIFRASDFIRRIREAEWGRAK